MTVIWESFCILLSLQIGQEFNYWALTYHYTVVRQRLHRAHWTYTVAMQVCSPQRTDSLTWWPIKSKVQQPLLGFMVTFDINHRCPGSAVRFCPQDSSDHSLTLLSNNRPQTSILHWEGTYWTWGRYCQRKKKLYLQAVIPLEVSLTALLSLWAVKGQNLQVGPFFFWRNRENCVDFGVPLVSLHHRSEGSSDRLTFWFRQCTFDFDVSPCNFPRKKKKKRLWHVGVVCVIFTVFSPAVPYSLSWETTWV